MRAGLVGLWLVLGSIACSPRTGGDRAPAGTGGAAGSAGTGGAGGAPPISYPLPKTISLGGDASAIAVADLDGDGYRDIAAIVKRSGEQRASVVVAFGDPDGALAVRWEHDLEGAVVRESRDSAACIAIGDLDADGRLDLATASGVALGREGRSFSWQSFGMEAQHAFQPAAIAELDARVVVRGSADGLIERCDASGACQPLPGQTPPCAPGEGCAVEDLVVGDFDGDSKPDVLGGGPPWTTQEEKALLWTSSSGWQAPAVIAELATVDLEAGDIDQDGVDDVVAQQRETISDFPAYTDVWLGSPGGVAPLFRAQTIYNHDNHNDAMALADASFDGCLDLLRVGVDTSQVALRLGSYTGDGCVEFLGEHDPSKPADVGWIKVPGVSGSIGIQQLDVNGDGIPEWIVRAPPLIHLLTVPPL
jgi:hypothetical protein